MLLRETPDIAESRLGKIRESLFELEGVSREKANEIRELSKKEKDHLKSCARWNDGFG